ncbi:hypothetical protein BD324DRAFT_650171 [Kockovaella imperatae]|uniref:Zinc finger protein 830 n=1 Tax=Kockovaella imperatae TaxID=4999 RepID=A0A1Y1UHR8_9TREE|nr:hypothetical protein BD324DRAFT_650171 [Kockovaella imperatae]ORX37601.1 hypothetical protein BD324DRAFT_650171 [Kockovaella imperatae]
MDAKSLLRAKKAGAKIEHPYASYTSGQLKCSICAVPVTQWDAHLLTKQHRTSVAREKASQAKASAKRPAEDSSRSDMKRVKTDKAAESSSSSSSLPIGFFDAPRSGDGGEDEEEDKEDERPQPTSAPPAAVAVPSKPEPTGDLELDAFLSSLNEPDPELSQPAPSSSRRARQRDLSPSDLGVASYSAAPVRIVPETVKEPEEDEEPEPEETEAERRARLEREEKEEIMERLEAEQRAQEDADSRVEALKARMEMLKARRKARPVNVDKKAAKS